MYGKELLCFDATHKVLQYTKESGGHYPQFLLAVPTNAGYQVRLPLLDLTFY